MNALTTENVLVPNYLSLLEDGLSIDKTVHFDSDATPEQSRRPVRRPLPDEDDLRSLGCYTEECQQNTSEFQWLRKKIQLLRTEQRRMLHVIRIQTIKSV